MDKPSRFQQLVSEAKKNVVQVPPAEAAELVSRGEAQLIDVREESEWKMERVPNATHLSRGTIELDIEETVPDTNAPIICYCGGGGRSSLAAESLKRMGYTNVRSLDGGLKAWKAANLPTER